MNGYDLNLGEFTRGTTPLECSGERRPPALAPWSDGPEIGKNVHVISIVREQLRLIMDMLDAQLGRIEKQGTGHNFGPTLCDLPQVPAPLSKVMIAKGSEQQHIRQSTASTCIFRQAIDSFDRKSTAETMAETMLVSTAVAEIIGAQHMNGHGAYAVDVDKVDCEFEACGGVNRGTMQTNSMAITTNETGTGNREGEDESRTEASVEDGFGAGEVGTEGVPGPYITQRMQLKCQQQFCRLDETCKGYLSAVDVFDILRSHSGPSHKDCIKEVLFYLGGILNCRHSDEEPDMVNNPSSSLLGKMTANMSVVNLNLEGFLFIMDVARCEANDLVPKMEKNIGEIRRAFQKESQAHFTELEKKKIEEKEIVEEHSVSAMTALLLDTVPAAMIMVNALVIGISADHWVEATVGGIKIWDCVEMAFFIFFLGESMVKVQFFGFKSFICGTDRIWNWFDMMCIAFAFVDVLATFLNHFLNLGLQLDGMTLLKIIRLSRLARLVRLLRFRIFNELKMMVQGVVSGARVMAWAIVLLFFVIFIMGIVVRKFLGDTYPEFSTLTSAMFALFRCFTDGCTAYNGTPLQERFRFDFDFLGVLIYILVYLFVTIGIFNLIMAIFIDNVVQAQMQRKQQLLGENTSDMEIRINEFIVQRFKQLDSDTPITIRQTASRQSIANMDFIDGTRWAPLNGKINGLTARKSEVTALLADLDDSEKVITKDTFNTWLGDSSVLELFEEMEVETSTKYELFDALDADSGGELTIEELVSGLMKLRGPISKNDIVATRLKVGYMTELVEDIKRLQEDICCKLGIPISRSKS